MFGITCTTGNIGFLYTHISMYNIAIQYRNKYFDFSWLLKSLKIHIEMYFSHVFS